MKSVNSTTGAPSYFYWFLAYNQNFDLDIFLFPQMRCRGFCASFGCLSR
jgi:hypothetical protein